MSTDCFRVPRPTPVAVLSCLLAAIALTLPAAAAGADGSDAGKAAALERLQRSAGTGTSAAAVALSRQLAASRHASARVVGVTAAVPALTTPTDLSVAGTSGVVTISASSSASFVLFAADGTPLGAPGTVTTGAATVTATTWGWANGTHQVTAVDCTDSDPASCNTTDPPASTSFDLANDAPQITAPPNGGQVTGGFMISATSPGGGLRFLIDGTRRGFDSTAPYTFAYTGSALTPGGHEITVVQCSTDESLCSGPTGTPISITSNSLHPSIVSVSPYTFSPNGDQYKDSTKLTYSLPDTETVYVTVTNSNGTVERGPNRLGTVARGTHSWTWTGRTNSNTVVASGSYRITLSTSATLRGALVRGLVWHGVVVDNRPPSVTSLTRGTSVYPYRDGYRDAVSMRFRLGERAITTLTIRNSARHVVRTLASTHNPGVVTLAWNGRDAGGRSVAAGSYTWQLTVQDAVRNRHSTAQYRVVVSSKRLISRSVTILRNGDSFASAGGSDPNCAEASTSLSSYPRGVWLLNTCSPSNPDIAAAFYHVSVPAAAVYSRFTVQVYGWALYAPTSMLTGFGWRGGSNDFGIGALYTINTQAEGWYTIGSINAANYVSPTHLANIVVTVTSDQAPCDFDVKQVRIKLSYKILG